MDSNSFLQLWQLFFIISLPLPQNLELMSRSILRKALDLLGLIGVLMILAWVALIKIDSLIRLAVLLVEEQGRVILCNGFVERQWKFNPSSRTSTNFGPVSRVGTSDIPEEWTVRWERFICLVDTVDVDECSLFLVKPLPFLHDFNAKGTKSIALCKDVEIEQEGESAILDPHVSMIF